jgi:hypothetical protein
MKGIFDPVPVCEVNPKVGRPRGRSATDGTLPRTIVG